MSSILSLFLLLPKNTCQNLPAPLQLPDVLPLGGASGPTTGVLPARAVKGELRVPLGVVEI